MSYPITDPLHPDLVCLYPFDDASGTDLAGHYPATHVGPFSAVSGRFDAAQKADDLSAYVSVPGLGAWFEGKTEFTFSTWMSKPAFTSRSPMLFCVSHTSHASPYYRVQIMARYDNIYISVRSEDTYALPNYPEPANWARARVHIVLRFAPDGAMSLWYDGVHQGTTATTPGPLGACHPDAMFGRIPALNTSDEAAAVNVDQTRVFDRALTDAEIVELYAETLRYVAGVASIDGVGGVADIWVLDAATGALINTAQSDGTGAYHVTVTDAAPVYVAALHDGARPLMHGPIIPALL